MADTHDVRFEVAILHASVRGAYHQVRVSSVDGIPVTGVPVWEANSGTSAWAVCRALNDGLTTRVATAVMQAIAQAAGTEARLAAFLAED